MNKYEVTQRLCKELGIEYLHLNFGGQNISFTEEEYQDFKKSFAQLYLDLAKKKEDR